MKIHLISILLLFISCTNKIENNSLKIVNNDTLEIVSNNTSNIEFPTNLNYSNYDFLIQKYDSFDMALQWISNLKFERKNDSVFMEYDIFGERNINRYETWDIDSVEYAGYFLLKDFINNQVTFKIKNYRESWDEFGDVGSGFIYADVTLIFSENFDTLYWKLLKMSPYLLDEDTLLINKNKK